MSDTVLIVDGNATLAGFTARNLQQDVPGLEVLTAGTWDEATMRALKHEPSVLLIDLTVDGGKGADLIERISVELPRAAVIAVCDQDGGKEFLPGIFAVLLKPYDAADLAALVRRALAKEHAGRSSAKTGQDQHPLDEEASDIYSRLAALLSGLRRVGTQLRSYEHDPAACMSAVEAQLDELCEMVKEISRECLQVNLMSHEKPKSKRRRILDQSITEYAPPKSELH